MKISGFNVTIYGDTNIGLSDQNYKIVGNFYFDNEEELNDYITGLKDLHQKTFNSGVKIETFEEKNQNNDNKLNQEHDGC